MTAVTVYGLRPAEFWRLHPVELHWMHEARAPKAKDENFGLTDEDVASLYSFLQEEVRKEQRKQ